MSNIIPFPRAGSQGGPTTGADVQALRISGDILLFTGVRYERHSEPDPAGTTSGSRKRGVEPGNGRKSRRRA